ncbi:putative glycosyltransferase [Methanocella paludicola SANAE]|uniref:Glycosyltransferase n=1 Tax=Methanocella paludicola (strain DSM 17711 / JCM 13418 / NBRC 101707 / SANAE) TaxID=304371 RepID=D1YWZ2_METPS|nr:glycosyltransferase family 4 protein [Methanocella paludicola]BAI60964.1 putative glycosyltransferase [Methanocella paludicola SANAE]
MRVIFKQIKGNSGIDVWSNNLSAELVNFGVISSVKYYPLYDAFCPYLLHLTNIHDEPHTITHSNISCGFPFKNDNPLVVTEHHIMYDPMYSNYLSQRQKIYYQLIKKYEEKSLKVADIVTCVSKYTQQRLEKILGYTDSKVIYNGIDENLFSPRTVDKSHYNIDSNKKVLLFVGNLSKRKGSDLLPQIMKKLDDDYLLIATSGLRNYHADSYNNIRTLGKININDLVNIYNLCDIFIFPSRLEGFGLAIAEAMSCGKPVVTTNCSSMPELIIDGKGGFLCEKDNINDFSSNIKLIAEDDDLKNKMGLYNRRRILDKFTLERMAREYLKLYESI